MSNIQRAKSMELKTLPSRQRRRSIATETLKNLQDMFKKPIALKESPSSPPKIEFYKTYRNISRIKEKMVHKQFESSPTIELLSSLHRENLKPMPLGLLKADDVNLNCFSLGDRYAKALSSGLSAHRSLEKIQLQGNRFSETGSAAILKSLNSPKLQHLNLSENKLGATSIKNLIDLITSNNNDLKHVNLEATGLSVKHVLQLSKALETNSKVCFLNLAKNAIKDTGGIALGNMLKKNSSLKELDLHWNIINQYSAKAIFDGLAENTTLEQFDISWNCIGTSSEDIVRATANFLRKNKSLLHFDFSYNSLNPKYCRIIGEALTENCTLLGLHVLGNACTIDSLGFLHTKDTIEMNTSPSSYRRILTNERSKPGENCWICDQWREVTFKVPSPSSDQAMFMHTELEDYRPIKMQQKGSKYILKRVLPPAKVKFVFSDNLANAFTLPTFPMVNEYICKFVEYTPGNSKRLESDKLNVMQNASTAVFDIKNLINSKPRANPMIPEESETSLLDESSLSIKEWSIQNSIFKDYILDTPELLDKCFEYDWSCSQVPNFFSNELELTKTKAILKNSYRLIRNTYKALSTHDFGEIFSVSMNVMYEFLSSNKVFDRFYSDSDFGVNWNATRASTENYLYNPVHSLVRFEFLEMLVRIAKDKFSGLPLSQCVIRLLREIGPAMATYTHNDWREGYFSADMEAVILSNRITLNRVFHKFTGLKSLIGSPFISIQEFKNLCFSLDVSNEQSTIREIEKAYAFAMMTNVDELNSKKHMEMNALEFYEALTRVIASVKVLGLDEPVPIHIKLETVVKHLSRMVASPHKLMRSPSMQIRRSKTRVLFRNVY